MILVTVMSTTHIWPTLLTEGLLQCSLPSLLVKTMLEDLMYHLSSLNWRLFHFLVFVVYCFLKIFWIAMFKPHLDHLANMVVVTFYSLSIVIILWSRGLRVNRNVIVIPALLLYSKVLSPVCFFLKRILRLLSAWLLTFFFAVFYQAYVAVLKLLKYLRYLRRRPILALFTLAQWSYCVLIIYCQKNTCDVIWQALEYHIMFILFIGFLHVFWAGIRKAAQLILATELAGQDPLEAITAVLPPTVIPLNRRFPTSSPIVPPIENCPNIQAPYCAATLEACNLVVPSGALQQLVDVPAAAAPREGEMNQWPPAPSQEYQFDSDDEDCLYYYNDIILIW
ncbi:uncharacterized protein LOC141548231 [Sminthopsis crassicaudata]|uniref:uncharacterized protein LOC141548231 n=1 Tax=Sminthopsis crassicaudata TaxID=9301 RepID=UPI003D690356